jgi:hypothetical protein
MKTIIIILGCLLLCLEEMKAQHTKQKVKVHKIWVDLLDGSKIKGNLYSADKYGIKVVNNTDSESLTIIKAANIDKVKIRRKGKIGNSILIGAGAGVAFGGLLGFVSGDDEPGLFSFTKEEKAGGGAVAFGVLGTGVGALIGTKKEKIFMNGDINKYVEHLKIIQSYSMQKTNMLTN